MCELFTTLVSLEFQMYDRSKFHSNSKSFCGEPPDPNEELESGESVSEADEYPTEELRLHSM